MARTTGGGRVTTGIIVDETLVGYKGVIIKKGRLWGMWGIG